MYEVGTVVLIEATIIDAHDRGNVIVLIGSRSVTLPMAELEASGRPEVTPRTVTPQAPEPEADVPAAPAPEGGPEPPPEEPASTQGPRAA